MSVSNSTKPYLPHALRSKEFLTAREVRGLLRCSATTVREYLRGGRLTARRINQRRFLYDPDSVNRFLAEAAGHDRPA